MRKLDPREMVGSPVMFVIEVGAVGCTVLSILDPTVFVISITIWLWATALFATLAESVAESRGKAQTASLRASQKQTTARKVRAPQGEPEYTSGLADLPTTQVSSSSLLVGDVVVVVAGETIPGDGDVI